MNRVKAREITRERLAKWSTHLAECTATPAVLVGIGHGADAGKLVVCCTEDVSDEYLVGFLTHARELVVRRLAGERAVCDPPVTFNPQNEGGAK